MASVSGQDSRWYLTAEQLQNSPSRRCGMDQDQELNHRQNAAYLIQDMGQRLRVSQLCINTAIVYMHRFYAYHSFTYFHRNGIAAASLFLAAKVEEQPRKLETVIHIANACTASSKFNEVPDPSKESYQEQAQDLVFNENVLLQTLGFDVAVDHPHTHVVKTCHLVKACKDLAQTSYFLASNSLHLTTMCLQYKPTVVACFCIYLACKWSGWEIPQSTEGKFWFHYVDTNVNLDLLEQLTREFLVIYEKSPARLKTKLNSCKGLVLNKVEQQQQRPMSQPSSSSRSHPAGEHSRSQSSSHQRANHQKIPHAGQAGKEHVPSKSSSGQMPSKQPQPHANVAPSSSASASSSSMASNSCRPRPDRAERPIVPEPHFSAPQRTAGSTKGPLPPLTRGNIDNMTQSGSNMQATVLQQQQQQRSSQPSHDQQYYQQQANKNRNPMNPMTQPIPDVQRQNMKQEQRQHGKDQQQPKPIDPTKNQAKPQQQHNSGNNSGNLYPTNENQQRMSSTSRQPPYQQQLPNYNQAMASRKVNHPQQQSQPEHASVHQLKHPTAESTFRLTDDQCGPMVDGQELSSPPKQHKSIFSPEWNDSVNVVPQRPPNNGLNIKSNRDSPKKHRSETPKKDKRTDLTTGQLGNKAPSHSDKRGNGAKPGMPAMTVPQQTLPFDSTSTMSKHLNAGLKRMLPDDTIKQENGIDFREAKQRKLDVVQPLSPSFSLDCKPSLDVKPNISKLPIYPSENVPTYDHPMKTTSFNGIETNPDLVSSLLKESLCTDTKFHSSLSTVPHEALPQSLIKQEPSKYDSYEPSATLPQQLFETPMLPTQIKLEVGSEHGQRTKSEKKKKKDKHKHKDKDKDKTKDREERKKHKKDKDRQKDRERSADLPASDGHNPLKITIPRDKLISTQETAPGGFKITIPRDRIKPEPVAPPPASLKIKISKDLIGDYASGQQHNPAENNSNSHSHSSKKKDKDRDREKSKNSKHLDFTKQNGNNGSNGSNSNGGNATVTSANSSNSRNQSSNSNKEIWVNM
ncbi:cyclin-T isoform X3 [Bradysia coprophila]|uniref:cyclin-T isoform X3 n=1 Tax=Bradysia coprophila TaxID=38358 RepID=UPI00187DC4B6|nr:cyclin-T isoform X3 [Bradysia coprophila]